MLRNMVILGYCNFYFWTVKPAASLTVMFCGWYGHASLLPSLIN